MSMMERLRGAKKSLLDRVRIQYAYRSVFSSPQGEQVLRHICRVGHVTKSTFVVGDPHQTALNEGKRLLALSILKAVHKDHDKMIQQIERELQNEDS